VLSTAARVSLRQPFGAVEALVQVPTAAASAAYLPLLAIARGKRYDPSADVRVVATAFTPKSEPRR
jgi:hypothetical protein